MSVKVTVKDDSTAWIKAQAINLDNALHAMADAIEKTAKVKAPRLNGPLRNSGRIQKNGQGDYSVIYGGGNVPYGHYQEKGGDGRRAVRNYTTPGTGAHYLETSGDAIVKRGIGAYL